MNRLKRKQSVEPRCLHLIIFFSIHTNGVGPGQTDLGPRSLLRDLLKGPADDSQQAIFFSRLAVEVRFFSSSMQIHLFSSWLLRLAWWVEGESREHASVPSLKFSFQLVWTE